MHGPHVGETDAGEKDEKGRDSGGNRRAGGKRRELGPEPQGQAQQKPCAQVEGQGLKPEGARGASRTALEVGPTVPAVLSYEVEAEGQEQRDPGAQN